MKVNDVRSMAWTFAGTQIADIQDDLDWALGEWADDVEDHHLRYTLRVTLVREA